MTIAFDTLTFSKKLEEAGLDRKVSEALSAAMQDVALQDVATKQDLRELAHTLTVRGFAGLTALGGLLLAGVTIIR